jgi:hypothetical protein
LIGRSLVFGLYARPSAAGPDGFRSCGPILLRGFLACGIGGIHVAFDDPENLSAQVIARLHANPSRPRT